MSEVETPQTDDKPESESAAPQSRIKKWAVRTGVLFVIAIVAFFSLPSVVVRVLNGKYDIQYTPKPGARKLHDKFVVADLHADSLLWNRDLTARASHGHVDLPRMQEGGLGLQCFTIVTKTPVIMNFRDNENPNDIVIRALATAQGWPAETLTSLIARAEYQAKRLHEVAARSNGQFRVIHNKSELSKFLIDRKKNPKLCAGILGVEGAHCLEGKLDSVDRLFNAGVRMIGLTHFFDNELGGSAHGVARGGLTPFGKKCLTRMAELGIVVDLAHASPTLIAETCAHYKGSIVVSHTGVQGTANNGRNLSDESLRQITSRGGVIGIGFFKAASGGEDLKAIVEAIKYVAKKFGHEHVAYGSDWDGSVATPIDAAELPQLTAALIEAGFSESELAQIAGGNILRVFQQSLPEK